MWTMMMAIMVWRAASRLSAIYRLAATALTAEVVQQAFPVMQTSLSTMRTSAERYAKRLNLSPARPKTSHKAFSSMGIPVTTKTGNVA